jgi:hypothetical protein
MPARVGNPSDSPAMTLGDRCDHGCPGCDGSCEDSVRVINGEDHADGTAARPFWTGGGVRLDPEVGTPDRELRNNHVPFVVIERSSSIAPNAAS